MIAGILLSKKRLYAALEALGYSATAEYENLQTGKYRFWKTPWGKHFSVPDFDHGIPHWVLAEIIETLEKTRPAAEKK
jgi:hypothetical protein